MKRGGEGVNQLCVCVGNRGRGRRKIDTVTKWQHYTVDTCVWAKGGRQESTALVVSHLPR